MPSFCQECHSVLELKPSSSENHHGSVFWRLAASAEAPRVNAFREGLQQLGYTEAQNIQIEYRYGDGRPDRLSALATDLVRLNVDVIVAGGTPIRAAKNATTTVPIVMAMSPDPVGSGYVESLARPGRNIEGLSSMARELSGKRLELFRDVVPKIRRIGVLWSASSEPAFNETVGAAHALNLNIEPFQIHDPNEFEGAFTSMARDKPDGLFTIASAFLTANRKRILDFAARSRIPGMYHNEDFIEAGGLMSYAP